MKVEFELVMPNQSRALWLALGGTSLVFATSIGISIALKGQSTAVAVSVAVLLCGGGLYALPYLTKRVLNEPNLITITADRLVVLNQKTRLSQQALFEDIARYQLLETAEAVGLHLRLKDRSKVVLSVDTERHGAQGFADMFDHFETTLALYQQSQGAAPGTVREKTFFERPISTVLLVALSVGMAAAFVYCVITHKPLKSSSFLGITSFFAYATSWYAARKRRNEV